MENLKQYVNVAGVTFGKRQGYLAYLKNQNPRDIKIVLRREPNNEFDANAIRIGAHNKKTHAYVDCGYVPKETAAKLAPLMDSGVFINAVNFEIVGYLKPSKMSLGMKVELRYAIR